MFSGFCLGGGLFLGDALLLGKTLGLGFLAGGAGGVDRRLGLFVRRVVGPVGAVRGPGRDAREQRDEVAEADREEDGEEREAEHEHARAERREEAGEAARHHEVPHRAARVGGDVERMEEVGHGRGVARELQQARHREDEEQDAQRAAAQLERAADDEQDAGEHAQERHEPDCEADELVAAVGEPRADRADQVRRGRGRGHAQGGDVAPVVGKQGEEGEERDREHEEPDEAPPHRRFGAGAIGGGLLHGWGLSWGTGSCRLRPAGCGGWSRAPSRRRRWRGRAR